MIVSLAIGPRGLAQGAPQPLGMDVVGAPELTPEQKKTVCDYAKHWAEKLTAASSPADIENARGELLEPLRVISASISPVFRLEYSTCLVPLLQTGLRGENLHASVNSAIVLAQLGTDKAINALLPLCDKQGEPRWQVRLQAAYGCQTLLKSRLLDFRKTKDAVTRLHNATKTEDHFVILRHQLDAIEAADQDIYQPVERKQMRDVFIDSVNGVIDRIAKSNNNPHLNPLVEPAGSAVGDVREIFLTVDSGEKREIAQKHGPRLGALLSVFEKTWDTCREDPEAMELATTVVGTCDGFLPLLHGQSGSTAQVPQSRLKDAWMAGNRDSYAADLALWLKALGQPPYAKP